jgi:PAS domain-containing protein
MDSEYRADAEHDNAVPMEPFGISPVANSFERKVRRAAWWSAGKVAALYAVLGVAWILLSDRLLALMSAGSTFDLLKFGTLKGLAFVLVTATVLLLALRRALLRWHRFEIKARASAELMRTVAETLPDALVVLDADGRIRFANSHAREVLGVTRSQLIGNAYDASEWAITGADGETMDSTKLPFARVRAEMRPVMDIVHAIQPLGPRALCCRSTPRRWCPPMASLPAWLPASVMSPRRGGSRLSMSAVAACCARGRISMRSCWSRAPRRKPSNTPAVA